jgi:cell division protein FtsL
LKSDGRFNGRLVLLMLVAAVVLVGLYVVSEQSDSGKVFSQRNNAASSKQKGKKYRATRNLIIDQVTGEQRKPTEAELTQLISTIENLANTSSEGLQEYPLDGGGYGMDLQGRFQGVFLSRPRSDGSLEVKCVFTFEEGIEFLGIVEDTAATSGR